MKIVKNEFVKQTKKISLIKLLTLKRWVIVEEEFAEQKKLLNKKNAERKKCWAKAIVEFL